MFYSVWGDAMHSSVATFQINRPQPVSRVPWLAIISVRQPATEVASDEGYAERVINDALAKRVHEPF